MSCPHCENNFSLSEASSNQNLLSSEESEYALEAVLASDLYYPLCLQMEFRVMTVAVMAIVTMTTFLALVQESDARPSRSTVGEGWPEYMNLFHRGDPQRRASNECDNSSAVRELCQRCAKATKSKWAYPLCCEEEEDTRRFCVNFLNFGISKSNNLVDS
ncbi:unnamed protein product [Orchesella dallaii]|uniref:Uncharacterized protein n=1 Tax=Orchesella dallaii TaxID=48710 RepID=A0ABP1QE95_9HEXA